MATPALALCTNPTAPTIGEVIFTTIATGAILCMEVVHVEHVRRMAPGLGVFLHVPYEVSILD